MRRMVVLVVVVVVMVGALVVGGGGGGVATRPPLQDNLVVQTETDASSQQLDYDHDAVFQHYDSDNDGFLNAQELESMYSRMHVDMGLPKEFDHSAVFDTVWAHIDEDHDRLISKDEYFASFMSGLSVMDAAGTVRLQDTAPMAK